MDSNGQEYDILKHRKNYAVIREAVIIVYVMILGDLREPMENVLGPVHFIQHITIGIIAKVDHP